MKASKLLVFILSTTCITLLTSLSIPEQTHVASNVVWTKTHYELAIGDRLEIISNGKIFVTTNLSCSPLGVENNIDLQNKYGIAKTANFGCLIGKIGENGIPFAVGENLNIVVNSNGSLYLGINDSDLTDNKGEFLSVVTVTSNTTFKTDSISK